MSPQISVPSLATLADAIGAEATGEWFTVDQARIDAFADATEDHQWIHVDPERAKAGPFGAPIAHGYLTLSLLPRLTAGLFDIGGLAMSVNYGLDRLRFLQPVAAGSRVRAVVTLKSAEPTARGVRAAYSVTVQIEGSDKPALAAETLTLYVPAGTDA
ncbi:MaoC family dehydratase [Glycomyces sp. TRM65418]|uniref:MaoC family dehydratase n=1 Tax=Glycomyces sp. TRM65418 TaxID=2867006 RepID=UPI001CE51A09|nr:MaoC family dehydratase [Glycomyces sp. TRM65418]MCC3763218.1 MaoC family dehydratase [Glycomyces sp. TRM65418]QZD57222.1 MaoC family dehydratase [Glycomyces sp. TRM65418]